MGSFLISWCLWNYKFLVILFSDASVSQTFKLIDSVAFPTKWSLVIKGVLLPAITAAVYIFIYPYPAKFVYEFTRRRQKEINEVRQRIEDETPLTIEESRKIRADAKQTEKKYEETVDLLNSEISRLKDELANLIPKPSPEIASDEILSVQPIDSAQLALLKLLEKHNGHEAEGILVGLSNQSKIEAEFNLGELVSMKVLKKNYDQNIGDYSYEFTHEGRRLLLKNREGEGEEIKG